MGSKPANPGARSGLWVRKPLDTALAEAARSGYRRTLGPWDLIGIGVAAIVGAGIFAGIGVAAIGAGPAVLVSYVLAGVACVLTAFAYAELASAIPGSGSAYTYVFVALGRFPAFLVGWLFILYIVFGNMFIATAWAGYFNAALDGLGLGLPAVLRASYLDDPQGGINLAAALIMLVVTGLVVLGIRQSVGVSNALVLFKLLVVLFFIAAGLFFLQPGNYQPFAPSGASGIQTAAVAAFFAYVGFEAISTTAEEARNPRRDLPIAIVSSIAIAMVLYVLVAIVLTGMVSYDQLDRDAPLAAAFQGHGFPFAGALVTAGALAATTTVLIAFSISLPRVFQVVARDGFLPSRLAEIHPRFKTPVPVTLVGGLVTAGGAALVPELFVLDLTVLGTLAIYVLVCVAVLAFRKTHPHASRTLRTHWILPVLAIAMLAYMAFGTATLVQLLFVAWMGLGLAAYGFWVHARVERATTRPRDNGPESRT